MMRDSIKTACAVTVFALAAGLCWQSDANAQSWPNEPGGSQLLTDWGFSNQSWPAGWGSDSPPQIVSDGTAPASASNVARQTFPSGFVGGVSPNNFYFPIPGARELYAGYWWKASNPWQGHSSNGNKIHFFMGNNGSWNQVVEMYGPVSGPWRYSIYFPNSSVSNSHLSPSYGDAVGTRHIFPNISDPPVTLGAWHRIEHYAKMSTTPTSRDGILRWWVDGVLVGSFTDVNYPQETISEFQFSPTWGGVGDTKTQTDYFQWDHVRISIPNGGGGSTKTDTTPPASPINLRVN